MNRSMGRNVPHSIKPSFLYENTTLIARIFTFINKRITGKNMLHMINCGIHPQIVFSPVFTEFTCAAASVVKYSGTRDSIHLEKTKLRTELVFCNQLPEHSLPISQCIKCIDRG